VVAVVSLLAYDSRRLWRMCPRSSRTAHRRILTERGAKVVCVTVRCEDVRAVTGTILYASCGCSRMN
jgi:hypothetical protein